MKRLRDIVSPYEKVVHKTPEGVRETHTADIGDGDKLCVHHSIDGRANHKHMDSSFTLNSQFVKQKELPTANALRAYEIVRHSTFDTIRRHKPDSISFSAAEPRYADRYHKLAQHIAGHFGGKVVTDGLDHYVHFNHKGEDK